MDCVNLNLKTANNDLKTQYDTVKRVPSPQVQPKKPKDSFELIKKEDTLVEIDPNDIYQKRETVETVDTPQNFVGASNLGASFSPQKIIKWGGRLWAIAEFYDTLDAYYDRFKNMLDRNKLNSQ